MLHRTVALFAIAVALALGVSDSSAQPGGKKGGGTKQLEAEIAELRAHVKALEAKLSKADGGAKKKDEKGMPPFGGFGKGGFGGFGKGFGPGAGQLAKLDPEKLKRVLQIYELAYGTPKKEAGATEKKDGDKKRGGPPEGKGWRKFAEGKKEFGKKEFGKKEFGKKEFGKKEFGKKEFGKKEFGKKEFGKKEFGKKEFAKGKDKGPGAPRASSGSVESRIERLIGELEHLRRELKKK